MLNIDEFYYINYNIIFEKCNGLEDFITIKFKKSKNHNILTIFK